MCQRSGPLETAEVFRFGLIGRLAEEGREGPDGPDVVGLRFGAEMPDGHVVDHATAQWADGFVAHGGSCPRRGTHDLRTSHAGPITSRAILATSTARAV